MGERQTEIRRDRVFALVLGRVIHQLREGHGLKQTDLALRAGMSQSVLSRMEAGSQQPTIAQFQQLARSLGTDVSALTALVDDALARTRRAAEAATEQSAQTPEAAWNQAVAVAGVSGLVGLIGFAVAAAVAEVGSFSSADQAVHPPS